MEKYSVVDVRDCIPFTYSGLSTRRFPEGEIIVYEKQIRP